MEAELIEENGAIVAVEKKELLVAPVASLTDRLLVAAQGGLSIDMLEKFMDLAERNERREAEKAFHKAFAEFKANPPEIIKDKEVDYKKKDGSRTHYFHATLGNIVRAIIAEMSKYGLSHRWTIQQNGSRIKVGCVISHYLGHSETTWMEAEADLSGGKNAIQAIASTTTYLERYTLQAATGIAVLEEDDDGQGAGDNVGFPKDNQSGQKDQGQKQQDKKEQGRQQGQAGPQNRENVEKWLDWIDSFIGHPGATPEMLEAQWKELLEPFLHTFQEGQQHELKTAYKGTMDVLKEKGEGK